MGWVIAIIVVLIIAGIMGNAQEAAAKKKKQEDAEFQRLAAEDYIMKSGDKEAIKQLMLMKTSPSHYQQNFQQAASGGNSVMRTAFGVFTGFIAADLVMGAINQHQLQEALASFDTEIDKIGGVENLELTDASDAAGDIDTGDVDTEVDGGDDFDFFS